jgi:sulfate adenylyltransferase large subunit
VASFDSTHAGGSATLAESPESLQSDKTLFAIEEFLSSEASKDLLRFSTAGSVDDGKSTLIGRLLYDSRNVYEDQVRAVTGIITAPGKKQPTIDFAQLTDGLRAEREQGITIDVAYRYFSTQQRKFIIADTPGHEQYTRNMATGASTADLAIILIDARKGILTQSRRHAYIASLLGIRRLVAAVNKMDLVDFSEDVYRRIETELTALVKQFGPASLVTIPVSALNGDNVVERSLLTPWYSGPTLLEHLEQVSVDTLDNKKAFRLPVQRVIRPNHRYRGFAGQIAAGTIRKGDAIIALPSGRTTRVASITTFDGDLDEASAPQSIALTLEEELDISRGDLIADPAHPPQSSTAIEAALVWFDESRLEDHKPYLLKHGAQTFNARITRVLHRINIQTLEHEAVHTLGMNDIGIVEIATTRPIFFDSYTDNRATGSFILIDPGTNATIAAGMIRRSLSDDTASTKLKQHAALLLIPDAVQASEVEQLLLGQGVAVVRTRVASKRLWQAFLQIGVIVLLEGLTLEAAHKLAEELPIEHLNLSNSPPEELLQQLREKGVLPPQKGSRQ